MTSRLKAVELQLKRMLMRNQAFQRCFLDNAGQLTADAKIVFAELRAFCHAERASYKISKAGNIDPMATHVAEGRREVWNRILDLLYLDDMEIRRQVKEVQQQMKEDYTNE